MIYRLNTSINSNVLTLIHFARIILVDELYKMGKFHIKHQLYTCSQRIITCMCYTTLIIGWHTFNCISLFGVMSVQLLYENTESTLAADVVNFSHISIESIDNQQENFSSVIPSLTQKRSMEMSKLDFATPNAVNNAPIQGWECYCWNTTTGYEVNLNNKTTFTRRIKNQ